MLDEFEISARKATKPYSQGDHGSITLSGTIPDDMPAVLGNHDPLRILQSFPAVSSNSEFSSGISVQGSASDQNVFMIDGVEVVNPIHLLGFFSTFNTPHFKQMTLANQSYNALMPDCLGGYMLASTATRPDTLFSGEVTAGLIEAHATLKIPVVKGRNSLKISLRRSYLDVVFPDIIKFDHADLRYAFNDANLDFTHSFGGERILKATFFYSADKMRLDDSYYDSRGNFHWRNISAGLMYEDGNIRHQISYSGFSNGFRLAESGAVIDLPSSTDHYRYTGSFAKGAFSFGWEQTIRGTREQIQNRENSEAQRAPYRVASETSLAVNYRFTPAEHMELDLGLRCGLYTAFSFVRAYPMPRVNFLYRISREWSVGADYGMHTQFSHLVMESATGLPTNFFINASKRFPPQRSHSIAIRVQGSIPAAGLDVNAEIFGKIFMNVTEYDGALLNMINSGYSPLSDLLTGKGRACGLNVSVVKSVGNFRGWVGYALSRSENRFRKLDDMWHPAAHDRTHDLNLNASYTFNSHFSLAASYVYATGTPYTDALYGYMIGENLICEYEPHNASRLPDYRRLDLSGEYRFRSGKVQHEINISFYNLLFNKNVIFQYVTYSPEHGIYHKESRLASVIPSISYTLRF